MFCIYKYCNSSEIATNNDTEAPTISTIQTSTYIENGITSSAAASIDGTGT